MTLATPPAVELAGVRIDALDQRTVVSTILDKLDAGHGGWLVNPNVDVLRQIESDPRLRRLVSGADLVVADGAPVAWAACLAGSPVPRVPGATFIWTLSAAAATRRRSIFLLGGNPGVGRRAGEALAASSPGLVVAGTWCPPFGFERDPAEIDAIRAVLRGSNPDIVFCGLGFPKQERLMALLAPEHPRTWFIGSGASLSFAAGEVARAPGWMQRTGTEWVFRLLSEPRRLCRRYLIDDMPYAAKLLGRSATRGIAARIGAGFAQLG